MLVTGEIEVDALYSIENAERFKWASITGHLNRERVSHLEKYMVGTMILDAGCGGGAYVDFLSRRGLEVTGVDKHDRFLQVARQEGRRGNYVQGDVTKLPFKDKTFDCTYCFDVLEHVDDKITIKELARVTSARMIIAVPKEDNIMTKFGLTFFNYQDRTHLRYYTEQSLKKLIATIDCSRFDIFPEQQVAMKALALEMVSFQGTNSFSLSLVRKGGGFLLRELLERASYKQVYTGLVVVVDL